MLKQFLFSLGGCNERSRTGCIHRNCDFLYNTRSGFTVCLEKTCSDMGIKGMKREDFIDNKSLDLLKESGTNVLLATIDDVINWGEKIPSGRSHLQQVAAGSK